MQTINDLLRTIADGEIMVANVEVRQLDLGEVLIVDCQSMDAEDVLSFQLELPSEVVGKYDLQDAGAKFKAGIQRLGNELRSDDNED